MAAWFFSRSHGTYTKIDQILNYLKNKLTNLKELKIIQCVLQPSETKPEVSNQKIARKNTKNLETK
jgi:hypothetical protein